MPPKPKYTREDVIKTAFEITREAGIEAVVARDVGKRLGTTVSPIFTLFENMDELKSEVYDMAKRTCTEYLSGCKDFFPAFKELGIRWVKFALNEPNLYHLLFLKDNNHIKNPDDIVMEFENLFQWIVADIQKDFKVSQEEAGQLLRQMLIHANGLSAFCINGNNEIAVEEIAGILSEAFVGMLLVKHIQNDDFNIEMAKWMTSTLRALPVKKAERKDEFTW